MDKLSKEQAIVPAPLTPTQPQADETLDVVWEWWRLPQSRGSIKAHNVGTVDLGDIDAIDDQISD